MLSDEKNLLFLTQIAKGLAGQFGGKTTKSLSTKSMKTILTILLFPLKNGHVSSRHLGDGPSQVVLEALKRP